MFEWDFIILTVRTPSSGAFILGIGLATFGGKASSTCLDLAGNGAFNLAGIRHTDQTFAIDKQCGSGGNIERLPQGTIIIDSGRVHVGPNASAEFRSINLAFGQRPDVVDYCLAKISGIEFRLVPEEKLRYLPK